MEGTVFIEGQDEQTIDLNIILTKCKRNWYWFVAGLFLAMAGAFFYIQYATPVYETSASLLIKDGKGSTPTSSLQDDVLAQLNFLTGNSNILNEMPILQSRTIVGRVIKDLGLQSSYYIEGRYQSKEIYKSTPVLVTPLILKDSVNGTVLTIKVDRGQTYTVIDSENNRVKVASGQMARLSSGTFLFQANPESKDTFKEVIVEVVPLNAAISHFQKNLHLSQTDKQSSVIELTFKTTVPRKGEDFLNSLIREYSLAGLADKNRTAANTIQFVDSRLDSISGELSKVEIDLQNFLSAHSIANIDEQSKVFINQADELDQQIMEQSLRTNTLKQILAYVDNPANEGIYVPSTLGIEDPILLGLVENYNKLQLQRTQQLQAGAGKGGSIIGILDTQLDTLRRSIKKSAANLLKVSEQIAQQLQERNTDFQNKITNIPKIQRDLITLRRQQEIKSSLYVYMLQKREEASITEAASVFNNRIIDSAMTIMTPIEPQKKLIYLAAFLLGLAIPGTLIYLKGLLNKKVGSRQDVESHTMAPVYAEISHSKIAGPIIVVPGSRTVVAEQFRNLRTNLSFVLGPGDHKVILITSSMGGEGKSFISLNLAMTYALMGKRTVLLGLDLRKPKIGTYVGMDHIPGISNYLSGQFSLEELPIELNYGKHNLYFINSGPIPPNPAELLLQPTMPEMINYLKRNFDYIIMDTPPVGLVTDAQILGEYADTCLYIVRHHYTMKTQMQLLDNYYRQKKLPNMGVILNDIKAGDAYRYNYGGYGYGNGYYSENLTDWNGEASSEVYNGIKEKG